MNFNNDLFVKKQNTNLNLDIYWIAPKIHLLLTPGQYLPMDTANNTNMLRNQASSSSVHLLFHCIRKKNGTMSQTEVNLLWPLKFKMHSLKPEFLFKPV